MKLSAYHKGRGDTVTLIQDAQEHFDLAYISQTFYLPELRKIPRLTFSPNADVIYRGGSGGTIAIADSKEVYTKANDPPLPTEIEHIYPDYSLYPKYTHNAAYGFLTRGCPNNCGFCLVSNKEGCKSIQVAELDEFWRGQREIRLLDPNILACAESERLLNSLIASKAHIIYTQGIDARFINDDNAALLCKTNIKMIHFAFDSIQREERILRGLRIFAKHSPMEDRTQRVYILTNYDTTYTEDWYRVKKVIELGYQPDVRIYRKGTHERFLTDLARWANNNRIYRSCRFEEYVPRADGIPCGTLYKSIMR
jgi:hypothetical protein